MNAWNPESQRILRQINLLVTSELTFCEEYVRVRTDEHMGAINAAKAEADERYNEIRSLQRELDGADHRLQELRQEAERLATLGTKESWRGDTEKSNQLKEAWVKVDDEANRLEDRIPRARAELKQMLPSARGNGGIGLAEEAEWQAFRALDAPLGAAERELVEIQKTLANVTERYLNPVRAERREHAEHKTQLQERIQYHPDIQQQLAERELEEERRQVAELRARNHQPVQPEPLTSSRYTPGATPGR